MRLRSTLLLALAGTFPAWAATPQASKPPVAEVWIDLSTSSSNMPGIPGMGMGGGLLGGLFGGKGGGNNFGNTRMSMGPGRWMDVTLMTRNKPDLQTATQAVPEGSKLAPTLKLVSPEGTPPAMHKETREDEVEPMQEPQRPKGKVYLYWGCGSTVRKGQPKVLDMATAAPEDFMKVFQGRRATTKGTHSTPGQPIWPNKQDNRMIPEGASLVGDHVFSGDGVPDGFKVAIDQMHDLMPAIALQRADGADATTFSWQAMDQARAYFLVSMGSRGEHEMVIWTSSELPDSGFGLLDYQPNASVDRWLKDKILLSPKTTECAAPKEALGQGMVRMIAYGDELNVAYPPRPKDPKKAWEPQWAAKVRLKSVAMSIAGGPGMGHMDNGKQDGESAEQKDKPKAPAALDVLKGLFGK